MLQTGSKEYRQMWHKELPNETGVSMALTPIFASLFQMRNIFDETFQSYFTIEVLILHNEC